MKNGYKQTEIGFIPEDWNCAAAKYLVRIETGSRNTEHKTDAGKYPFFVRSQKIEHIDTYHYDCEAVLTAGDGVGTGKVFHHYIGKFDAHQRVYVMSDFKGITGRFFYNYFSENFGNEVSKYTAKSSVDSVRRDMIAEMLIPTPPIPEQERIAEALSDVDSMISSLEKLITKKKAVKQGAMQELLTGKRRIKGFSEDWQEHTLGDLCYLVTKQTGFDYTNEIKPSLVDINSTGTLPFIQNKDFCGKKINIQTDYYIPYDVAIKYPRILLDETCLLISLSGRIGNVGLYEKSNGLAFIGGAVGICRFNSEQNAEWCMLYLQSSSGQKQIFECQKSGAQHNLTVEDVRKLVVKLPTTLEEQTAIASILSNMDNEIESLEHKLSKTRQIKQGMMQQLLTGKIRLVSANADNKPIEAVSKPHHNHQFDDAVVIAAIVNEFYTDGIPLGRKKVQKLLYLLRRKQEADTSAFKKKAAGPYADEVRYKGGEPIAIRNKYVAKKQGAKGTTFSKGEKIEAALEYIKKWEMTDDINWLVSTFKYTKTNDLELFATIDMAICDLINSGEVVSVASIKNLIASNKEWKDKLSKTYFSDNDISRAIRFCQGTFN